MPVSGCRHVAVKACVRSQDQSLIHEQLWGSELLMCTCVAVGLATGTRVAVRVGCGDLDWHRAHTQLQSGGWLSAAE